MLLLNESAKEAAANAVASPPGSPDYDVSQSFAALPVSTGNEIHAKEVQNKSQKIAITFLKSHQKELTKMPQLLQNKIKKQY